MGPAFEYSAAPGIFLGRTGSGPLKIAWDTSVLILFQQFGEAFWDNVEIAGGDHLVEQVEALGGLINPLWLTRDIRFQVLPESLSDFQRRLPDEDARKRFMDAIEAAHAFQIGLDDEDGEPSEPRFRPIPPEVLARLPSRGVDRRLVDRAQRSGAHVFLTNDRRLARRAPDVKPYGILLARPSELLDELALAGELTRPLDWPAPDLQRVVYLLEPFNVDT